MADEPDFVPGDEPELPRLWECPLGDFSGPSIDPPICPTHKFECVPRREG